MTAKQSRRDYLVETAQKLFYQHGFKQTGIDTILEHSGVAKRTLYNHFKSKDELVIATLNRRDIEFMAMIKEFVKKFEKKQEGDPKYAKILAYFDALSAWFSSSKFNGCMFINASAEYPRKTDPIHVACTNHKRLILQYLEELISELKFKDSNDVAMQLNILSEGAIVSAHTADIDYSAEVAKKAAVLVLNANRT